MIFDNDQQKKDFIEILERYPVPNAATGYQMIQVYLPAIQQAPIIPLEDQPKPTKDQADAPKKG